METKVIGFDKVYSSDDTHRSYGIQELDGMEIKVLVGIVKFYNDNGWGFIKSSVSDYFYHRNSCVEDVKAGDEVSFRLRKNRNKYCAVDIKKLN